MNWKTNNKLYQIYTINISLFIRDYKNHSYETFMNHFNMIFGCIQSIKIVSRKKS